MERSVWAMAVVMSDVDAEHAFEVSAVHDQEPVEAFAAHGPDEAFSDRVRSRRSHRCLDDADAFARKDGVEVPAELAVAVANQEAEPTRLLLQDPRELTRLLGNPSSGRVGGAASGVNAAASEFDEKEDVDSLQRDRLDGEEVDRAMTASKHVLGVMNQMAFEIEWVVNQAGGLWNVDIGDLNRHLHRSLHTKDGEYRVPLELVHERLRSGR